VKAPVSWLREFVDLPATATVEEIASRIGSAGFEVAGIEGDVIDFEVTANRPDCLSIRGLAREAATGFGVSGPEPRVQSSNSESRGPGVQGPDVPVTIESPLCGRYALAIADVTVGPSP
jgi:phenylalanyl-tRNA synthetase beta chain